MLIPKFDLPFFPSVGRKLLLASCIFSILAGVAHAGSCTGAAGVYTCSGAADSATDTTQNLTGSPLVVTTEPGFGLETSAGDGFTLSGTNFNFIDNYQSTIQGANRGIYANNTGSGTLSISTNGTVTGGKSGIYAINRGSLGTGLTIQANNINAVGVNDFGIAAINEGTGSLNVTATGNVISSNGEGIRALNQRVDSVDLIIHAHNVSGEGTGLNYGRGIFANNNGTGVLSITATGSVSGAGTEGIYAGNVGSSLNIQANNVSGDRNGIYASTLYSQSGSQSIITTGMVTGTNSYGILALTNNGPISITINSGSTVQGKSAGIDVFSTVEPARITNHGTIRNLSGFSSDKAITGYDYDGNATDTIADIDNHGLVLGTVELGNGGSQFTNNTGGTWDTAGGSNEFGLLTAANSVINNGLIITANGLSTDPTQTTTFNNIGTFTNSGSVSMGNGRMGDLTIINGDYVGNGGEIVFDTALGDDNSPTDKLQINGNTSGSSLVTVNGLGGSGAETIEGIELITVSGLSDGEFMQSGRIVAGAYDYFLMRGADGNDSNWYLSGRLTPDDVLPPPPPPPPPPEEEPNEPGNPMVERPEDGAYTANLAAANTMFATRLHDRLGETRYVDVLTGEKRVTSMWLRSVGSHNRSRDESGQLRTLANRYVVQLGGDLAQWSANGQDRFHLGVMAGYGNHKSTTSSSLSGYQAKGKVDGYSTGFYGIWQANEAGKTGMYMDAWVQYSWLNNTVAGEGLPQESYKSKGMTGSFEVGYLFNLGENAANNWRWFIQPQAQVVVMGVKANDHTETNGTQVSSEGYNNTQTRLGVRAFANGYGELDKGKNRVFQPFVEVNWIYNSKDFGTRLDGVSIKQAGTANIAELKVGVEGQLNQRLNLWGNIVQQVGNKGYSDSAVTLGVKYSF